MPTVAELDAGKKDKRLEAAITEPLDTEIMKVARELAGGKTPKMFRSKAVRLLLAEAVIARQERAARRARRAGGTGADE